jgi:hypothetical protein
MDEDQFERLLGVIELMAGGKQSGPSGLEALAMAIAGDDFITRKQSLAGAIEAVASALERIADHFETEGDQ